MVSKIPSKSFLAFFVVGMLASIGTYAQGVPNTRDSSIFRTSYACEGELLDIECAAMRNGSRPSLEIVRANFGRFSIAICNDEGRSDLSVNCLSPDTKALLQNTCFSNGPSSSCSVIADPLLFGSVDLCPETSKYLEVHYKCTLEEDLKKDSSSTTTYSPPPSWLTTSLSPSTSSSNISAGIQTPPPVPDVVTVSGKKRIPITPRPKSVTAPPVPVFTTTVDPGLPSSETSNSITSNGIMSNGVSSNGLPSNGLIKEITSKFLSSSVASTNIMDTSEVPLPILNNQQTSDKTNKSDTANNKNATTSVLDATTTTTVPTTTTTITTTSYLQSTNIAINRKIEKEKPSRDKIIYTDKTSNGRLVDNDKTSNGQLVDNDKTSNGQLVDNDKTSNGQFVDNDKTSNGRLLDNDKTSNGQLVNNDKTSKGKIIDDDKISKGKLVDVLDDHDEQPDETANVFDIPKYPQASLAEKDESDDEIPKCHPISSSGIDWPATRSNATATRACPSQALFGRVSLTCGPNSQWLTLYPDMSQCRSEWLTSILKQLDRPTSVVHLANDMEHQVASAETLFGGDLLGLSDAIERMTDKMRLDLEQIPTTDQRRAVVTEVVQRIVKTVGAMTSPHHLVAWQQLGGEEQTRKSLTKLMNVLENAGLLLPEAVGENEEVTITSTNVLLSVKKVNFHHMGHTRFPSSAAVASKDWSNYSDHIQIPSLVMMEHMQRGRGVTEIIFISFRTMGLLMKQQLTAKNDKNRSQKVLSSPVISLTMGRRVSSSLKMRGTFLSSIPIVRAIPEERLPEPISIFFEHKADTTMSNPLCVLWDVEENDWTGHGCYLISNNETHTHCECNKLATIALMQQLHSQPTLAPSSMNSVSLLMWLVILVLAICLSVILIMSVAVIVIYCRKRQKRDNNAHKRLESSPSISVSREPSGSNGQSQTWSRFLERFCPSSESNHRRVKRQASDLFPGTSQVSGSWSGREDIATPTFATNFNRQDQNFMTRTRRANLHLDLEPMSSSHDQRGTNHWPQPVRGATSESNQRSRNALSLNFQGYRRPFLPPKELVATPERPLLEEDFPSPDTVSTTSHIYMEVGDPQAPVHPNRSRWNHGVTLQPIHRPLQTLLDSSASSQSSGYGSSASPHLNLGHGVGLSQLSYNYDNVRGEMRGPFVRYPADGRTGAMGHQSDVFTCQSLHAPIEESRVSDVDNKTPDIYLHDSQFV